jgi:hypothetical protein
MTVETITEHDQPGSEPGNPSPPRNLARHMLHLRALSSPALEGVDDAKWAAALAAAIDALFLMSLQAVGYPVPLEVLA